MPLPGELWFFGLAAREFRHATGRSRYLQRDLDPQTSEPLGDAAWTDYDGEMPYGDFSVSLSAVITETRRYLGGLGLHAQQAVTAGPPGPLDTVYLHGDLVGSTVLLTDAAGMPVGSQAYTAFGEAVRLDGGGGGGGPAQPRFGGRWNLTTDDLDGDGTAEWSGTRYAYCGAWGYESGLLELAGTDAALPPIELVHVGARWYDPALGRFVQRDPGGVASGLNTYAYCVNSPVARVDPEGWTSVSVHQAIMQLIVAGLYDQALDLITMLATDGMLTGDDAQRLVKALEAAKHLAKWRKQMLDYSLKKLREQLCTLTKNFWKHVKMYKDHPGSEELGRFRYQINWLEEQIRERSR